MWPRKDVPCVVLGSHYKLGRLHYKGYLIIITAICNAHSNLNLLKPTAADSPAREHTHTSAAICVRSNVTRQLFPRHIAAPGSTRFSPACLSRAPQCRRLAGSRRPCGTIEISQPELPASFKGSSQDAHLMQREGRLKPQPGHAALKQLLQPLAKRSQIISSPSTVPLCESCTRQLYLVAACEAPSRITPLHFQPGPTTGNGTLRDAHGRLDNKYIHAFIYISNKNLTQPA